MTQLLSRINSSKDLKKLTLKQLNQLAEEIRTTIIKVVSKNGGHLAPNLGVVELTLSLHQVFDSSKDKIIFDVGHQSYIHKLLTGRKNDFGTLRQFKGISGFPKIKESDHDPFGTGHSSTSISSALGIALARDLKGDKFSAIAVIGDGALTGGMAFEALNHAGHTKTDMIVVLNDNEMSIAENVGALSSYLSRMRTDPKYFKGKEEIEDILKKIPAIGSAMLRAVARIKDSFKYLLVPGMLFEELGFTYLGPIDGHNIASVKSVLENAKKCDGPVLVHVITKKGKGYKPAEENPDKFHGVGPFEIGTGKVIKEDGPISYTEAFASRLNKLASEKKDIVAITAAMPGGTGLNKFAERYPERFYDVGIAEQHAVTLAGAMATQGLKPVVAVYSTFLQRAYDQINHDICLQNLPVVFALDRAGIVGEDGPTHHGLFDISYLRHIPNLVMMAPKDQNELGQMLNTAVEHPGPVAIRYPRGSGVEKPIESQGNVIPIGKAEVLKEGKDLTILTVGPIAYEALQAAEELAKAGVEVTVINSRFVKPLDKECILKYGLTTGCVLTIEEHVLAGGFGSSVMELMEEYGSQIRVFRLGIPDEFVEHGSTKALREKYNLTTQGIIKTVNRILEYRKV